jgi:hypothetical protein
MPGLRLQRGPPLITSDPFGPLPSNGYASGKSSILQVLAWRPGKRVVKGSSFGRTLLPDGTAHRLNEIRIVLLKMRLDGQDGLRMDLANT